jgi:hypothetical protein
LPEGAHFVQDILSIEPITLWYRFRKPATTVQFMSADALRLQLSPGTHYRESN